MFRLWSNYQASDVVLLAKSAQVCLDHLFSHSLCLEMKELAFYSIKMSLNVDSFTAPAVSLVKTLHFVLVCAYKIPYIPTAVSVCSCVNVLCQTKKGGVVNTCL